MPESTEHIELPLQSRRSRFQEVSFVYEGVASNVL